MLILKKSSADQRILVALEEGIPITDPHFYSSSTRCSDETIRHIFRPAEGSREVISLLDERIRIMREVGSILCAVRIYTSIFLSFFPY